MEEILTSLIQLYPQLIFREGNTFYWSPEKKIVYFANNKNSTTAVWSLFHETSHALLNHSHYRSDFQLIQLEIAAWERAKMLAQKFEIEINEEHIQDCLDSYRDWLNARCICPRCNTQSLQLPNLRHYRCFNCHTVWKVTTSRFCRAYRVTKAFTTYTPSSPLFTTTKSSS